MEPLRTVSVTRYMQPLREGGSLPALAEADDGFKYVIKFQGSGQGVKTLIAELIGGEIARVLGLKIPELVFAELDEDFGRTEGDEEIQDLLKASQGLNLGLHFLSGAFAYDPAVAKLDPLLASKVVWLDALIANVDRSFRNTNMLFWNRELWLIDHGASFFFHHNWDTFAQKGTAAFPYIKNHVLLPQATQLAEADHICRTLLTVDKIQEIVSWIPDQWLHWEGVDETPEQMRSTYFHFLSERLKHSEQFTKEAQHAAQTLV